MAQMVRCKFGLFSLRFINRKVPHITLPTNLQRLCFHTSQIFDVKGKPILMPSLSPTMETGTIVKWMKKEGDPIAPGDALADIQTDKAVITMEFDDESIFAKIIVKEGVKDIKVGDLIALVVDADEDWKSVEMPDSASSSASAPSTAPAATSAPVEAAEPPPGQQNVAMPALSPTMTSGTIVKWLKQEGDGIEPGDAIAEIQTDKAVMTFEMDEEGVIAKFLVPEGAQAEVGQLIAIVVEKGMDLKSVVVPVVTKPAAAGASPAAKAPAPEKATSAPAASSPSSKPPPSGQVYGLAVKRLLEEYGLSSGSVKGTGRPNRLLKSDVLTFIQSNNVQKLTLKSGTESTPGATKTAESFVSTRTRRSTGPSTYKDLEVSNIRAVIAKRLGESKSNIPHSYASIQIKIDKLNEVRSKLLADNVKVSVNDFITKAVAHALLECPDINCLYQNGQTVRAPSVDVSVAVATPNGLITPIVFNAATKSLSDISANIRELAVKAREGKLKPQEFQGGSFTISNLGMFGISEFSAIINPPQTAILAVGTGRAELDVSLTKSTLMTVTLSYDRRAIDEDQAADFLAVLRAMLEEPTFLAVGRAQAKRYRRE
ncbi:dihydrolipoyllysine-residue acetyltransferase component of pyruvate dehydrogenase complex-like [Leptopilina heterotoma]|uniref:dihydrolipoyllysine-residue acetyltransferase component of pyruvate dehydrogenase complex-like n=1 Tax=Leptopilina heterotoma TaxID=63436 RepID=UPI001CA9A7AC|nr:dihydrolipoyllysine-residue acetyltransferase component of pyruvate dehydrogenase complex-like [Leptopilina heterotoma]